jgi:hypothetical protein
VAPTSLTEQLTFIAAQRHQDEATVLADAVRAGVQTLYRQVLVEGFLAGTVQPEIVVRELGEEAFQAIERQRRALESDVRWGLTRG